MHLLIPHASALSEACAHTLSHLALPHLSALVDRLAPADRDDADEYALSPPHERALAAQLGLRGDDGALPWAARAAAADGIDIGNQAWGLLTPVRWNVGRETVTLAHPASLALDEAASRAWFDAVRELFVSEGFTMAWGAPLRWYIADDSLDGLPCAALDRVVGRNVDLWLQTDTQRFPGARRLRRLQNEVQMLLYTHPLTDAAEAAGREAVNSVWLSGCGRWPAGVPLQPAADPNGDPTLTVDDRLRDPLLTEDWAAWAEAWQALDAGPLRAALAQARQGGALQLTLCGERSAVRLQARPRSLWQRARSALNGGGPTAAATLLAGL